MSVRLISITPDAEATIAYCARVSSPNQENPEIVGLLRYLIAHGHWSPFEMAYMTLEITTKRSISAQILRHKSFSFQEFSQRYAPVQSVEPIELRRQADKNRQSSTDIITDSKARGIVNDLVRHALEAYNDLLEMGVARECARDVLPLASTTRLYMAGTIRSWIHYIKLRTNPDTQKEHRIIAEECAAILRKECPTIAEAAL